MNLLEAVKVNNLDKIRTLSAKTDISQQELSIALLGAISRNNVQAVEILLQANVNVNYESSLGTPLTEAVDKRHFEIIQRLLSAGADLSIPNYGEISPPLMIAAEKGDLEMVKLLIKAGADVNQIEQSTGYFALASAAGEGHEDVFNYLAPLTNPELRKEAEEILPLGIQTRELEGNAEPLVKELSDLVFERNLDGVREILNKSVDINGFDETGNTALHLATAQNDLEIVRVLLKAGANPNLMKNSGVLPLGLGSGDITALLIKAGANVDAQDNEVRTVLMITAGGWDRLEKMKVLLCAGADLNVRDRKGKTALMYAVEDSYNRQKVRLLIEAGANIDARDNNGNTALFLAKQAGNDEIIQILLEAGAIEE